MITSVFKKSTPLNLILVVILMLVFFFIKIFQDLPWINSGALIVKKGGLFFILLGSIFITNFVAKKNGLSKDSSYTMFFCFLFLLFFPSVFGNINLLLSNFFILLALRRLISLQSLKASKEKIFDASLWIFVAALFHFWSILYIVLVFISIIFHVARDYRNWVLPFIAFFAVGIISVGVSLLFSKNIIGYITENAVINFDSDYFTNTYQNVAFSIYLTVALFFVISMFASLSSKLLFLLSSYKKIIASFFIAIVIFAISANKSNDLLIYTIAPLSIMATSHIEVKQLQLKQELVLGILILCSLFAFFSQL
ncbi:DUF6427 family protein [Flavobacterium sp.]|uniref:DUF6427 family protein n=1 Tax=Flavobacterium sp. TaxID=239 RepID=UPI00286E2329|nr:DUF6427 family protein [Flavobacterium sp.]